jgi:hypothetical protein
MTQNVPGSNGLEGIKFLMNASFILPFLSIWWTNGAFPHILIWVSQVERIVPQSNVPHDLVPNGIRKWRDWNNSKCGIDCIMHGFSVLERNCGNVVKEWILSSAYVGNSNPLYALLTQLWYQFKWLFTIRIFGERKWLFDGQLRIFILLINDLFMRKVRKENS